MTEALDSDAAVREQPATLQQALVRLIASDRNRVTSVFKTRAGDQAVTRADLDHAAAAYAVALMAEGVRCGDPVILAHGTTLSFAAAFWGIVAVGAVPVPTAPLRQSNGSTTEFERLRAISDVLGPVAAVGDETSVGALKSLGHRISVPEAGAGVSIRELNLREVTPSDTAIIQFTSGSTSQPRGAELSHAAVVANLKQLTDELRINRRMRGVNWCPLHHDMGLVGGVTLPVWTMDGTSVLMPPEDFAMAPVSWLRAVAAHKAVLTSASTTALALVVRRLRSKPPEGLDLSSLETLLLGAEPIDADVVEAFVSVLEPCGLDPEVVHPAYGLAENVVFVCGRPGGLSVERINPNLVLGDSVSARPVPSDARAVVSLGKPPSGTEIQIVDDDGAVLGDRTIGKIEVASVAQMNGYFSDAIATASAIRDGWLSTGDVGYTSTGELFVVGRSKDVIIIAGRNIHAIDIELALESVPGIRPLSSIAFSVPTDNGEALAVLTEARRGDPAELRAGIRSACARAAGVAPAVIEIVSPGELPRTSSGKPQRQRAREMFLAGEFLT